MATEYIDREEAICKFGEETWAAKVLEGIPAADVIPCDRLRRYAEWFCAAVSYPEFVREAISFCKSEEIEEAESRVMAAACAVCHWTHVCKNEDELMKHCECCPVEAALQGWPE